MVKALLFAVLFIIIGLVAFALLAPLLFPNADHRQLGRTVFPIIVLVCGGVGFVVGLRRSSKR